MSLKKNFLATKPTCKVTFTLPKEAATNAKEVVVVGEFNDWNTEEGVQMKRKNGHFEASVELETGRNWQFRYLIDQRTWENDWNADDYLPTPFGVDNSVIFLPETKANIKGAKPAAKKAVKKPTVKKATAKKTSVKKAAPKKTATAKKTTKDDLKKIEGVGPKIEQLLNAAGIRTFNDLSKAKKATLVTVLNEAGPRFKMHNPTTWAKQAKLADTGKWDQLNKLQDQLKGGK